MEKYIIGIAAISGMMVVWILIQRLWKQVFADEMQDPDVLAGRSDCGSCGCSTPCSVKQIQKTKNITS